MAIDFNKHKFLGVVEDNNDPDRQNKCRIRVINVFDGLPTEDLPWASPFKDTNGIACSLPDEGKVVSVAFENGDIYNPIYRYSEHYNVNLQEKLNSLTEDDYLSMKSLLFDHITQIYVNESEGLKLDHKFNMFNITENSIDLNLKDNFGSVNIGTADASQQAILGNHFLDWFDIFVDHLLGSQGGPFFGNLLAPVIPHPGFISHLLVYKASKDPLFLSHNVNFNDNGYVTKLDRINNSQKGDDWKSTTEENDITTNQPTGYEPKSGTKESNPTDINESRPPSENSEATNSEAVNEDTADSRIHHDIIMLAKVLQNKEYQLFKNVYEMNIIGVRYQYAGDEYSNTFSDKLYVFYKNTDGEWEIKTMNISTMPGTEIKVTESKYKKFNQTASRELIGSVISMKEYAQYTGETGLAVLQPAQYINTYKLDYDPIQGDYRNRALVPVGDQLIYRDSDFESNRIVFSSEEQGMFGISIKRGYPGGVNVNEWSTKGEQTIKSASSMNSFLSLMDMHQDRNGNKFTYTLVTSEDLDLAKQQIESLSVEEQESLLD